MTLVKHLGDQALSQNDRLRHLLGQLQRAQFGRRSERLDPEQLFLALEDIEQAIAGSEAADDKKDSVAARARSDKRRANRKRKDPQLSRCQSATRTVRSGGHVQSGNPADRPENPRQSFPS